MNFSWLNDTLWLKKIIFNIQGRPDGFKFVDHPASFRFKYMYLLVLQTKKAMDVGRPGRISVEDIIFLIRKDPKKYSRVKELLMMNEELRKARKAFDEIKYATTKWKDVSRFLKENIVPLIMEFGSERAWMFYELA